jgi:hypothetical protein
MELPPVLLGEVQVSEHLLGGFLEHLGYLGEAALQTGRDLVQLSAGGFQVRYPQRVCKWRRRCTLLLDENPGLGSPKEESHRHGPADHEG